MRKLHPRNLQAPHEALRSLYFANHRTTSPLISKLHRAGCPRIRAAGVMEHWITGFMRLIDGEMAMKWRHKTAGALANRLRSSAPGGEPLFTAAIPLT